MPDFSTKTKQTLKPKITMNHKLYDSLEILNSDVSNMYDLFQNLVRRCFFYSDFISSTPINLIENVSNYSVLQDHLLLQLHTLKLPYDNIICSYIINCLDKNGFLTGDIEDHCKHLKITENEFLEQLRIIQTLEPEGVGARNPLEAIVIQLKNDDQFFAIQLLKEYPREIENQDLATIAELENCDLEEIEDTLYIIKSTNPYPGLCFIDTNPFVPDYIAPDLFLEIDNDHIIISPSTQTSYLNELRLNKEIVAHPKFKKYMDEALFNLECLNKRNSTLLLITNEVVKVQKKHFINNEPLVKCTMHSIADKTGMKVSTISRSINNKYIQFDNEIIPIRSLFVTKKSACDDDKILNELKNIIKNENKEYPYSDYELCLLLKKKQITIARRTVAKYRTILNIPNSQQRKTK